MNYIFLDLETSGASTAFDSILECAAILTNDKLETLSTFHRKARLKEGIIPNLGALNVTGFDVNWLKQNPSPYSLITDMEKQFKKWGPACYFGYNSQLFDFIFIQKSFFQSLKPPYMLNTGGNKQGDILNVIRAAKLVNNDVIQTPMTAKGNPSFRLSDLMQHQDAHGALPDTQACLSVAKKVYQKTNTVWRSSLLSLSRAETEDLLQKEPLFCNVEYFYGKARIYLSKFILMHQIYRWGICWDLQHAPEDYIKMEYNELKKALSKSPKVLRTVKTNKSPVLLNPSYGYAAINYKNIPREIIQKRIKLLENSPEFLEKINSILIEQHEERPQRNQKEDLQPEETLYGGGFASSSDNQIMEKFHSSTWDEKVKLIDKFSDERFSLFSKKIIYEEKPEILPESICKEVKKSIADRIFSTEKKPWTTIPEFYKSIDDMRNKKENDESVLKKLDEYNNYVMDIEKKYETA